MKLSCVLSTALAALSRTFFCSNCFCIKIIPFLNNHQCHRKGAVTLTQKLVTRRSTSKAVNRFLHFMILINIAHYGDLSDTRLNIIRHSQRSIYACVKTHKRK